jgi:hypothetical protein
MIVMQKWTRYETRGDLYITPSGTIGKLNTWVDPGHGRSSHVELLKYYGIRRRPRHDQRFISTYNIE